MMMLLLRKAHPATRTMIGGDPTPEQAMAGDYPKLRREWHGLAIAIEHPEGTVREGVDETGKPWRTVFRYAYGEILGTLGMDGDPVDVFIGSYPDAPEVYIVQQMKRKQWDVADEQKVMIDFGSIDEAKAAYLGHYDDPRFFGGITAMPVDEFIAKVRATKDKPSMIKSILFFKGFIGPYLRGGKIVNARGYQGRSARAQASAGQMSLFGAGEPQHTEPTRELIEEHERLVDVLNSPSHEDDKVEAKKQAEELAGYKEEAAAAKEPTKAQQTRAPSQQDLVDHVKYLGGERKKDLLELAAHIDDFGYSNSVPDSIHIPVKNAAAAINHITRTSRISTEHGLAARKLTGAKARKVLADVAAAGGLGSIQDHIDAFHRIMGGQPMTKSIVFLRKPS